MFCVSAAPGVVKARTDVPPHLRGGQAAAKAEQQPGRAQPRAGALQSTALVSAFGTLSEGSRGDVQEGAGCLDVLSSSGDVQGLVLFVQHARKASLPTSPELLQAARSSLHLPSLWAKV